MVVYAVVVTYNRKALLCECLDAILNQSRLPDKIVVIDNASTDGTKELFEQGEKFDRSVIQYHLMEKNLGGAGGFYNGIKCTLNECDYIWLMDDDTIPAPDALAGLCESLLHLKNKVSFLASMVFGPNGEPMNLPVIDTSESGNGYANWYFHLHEKMVKIKSATFVSLLINTEAIKKVGLPLDWFFIWGDDTEYTLRLTKYFGPAYISGNSVVEHRRFNVKNLSIRDENNLNRIKMYFYFYRNMLINKSEYESRKAVHLFLKEALKECARILLKPNVQYRIEKIKAILHGVTAYLFKRYDYIAFKHRVDK